MASIIYVGMDVHSNSYSLCCYSIEKVSIQRWRTPPSKAQSFKEAERLLFLKQKSTGLTVRDVR